MSNHIHVTGDIGGRHVTPDCPAALRAGSVQVSISGDPLLLLLRRRREGERSEVRAPLFWSSEASQRGASIGPARIETHNVESRPDFAAEQKWCGEQREVDARSTRPPRIEQERSDSMLSIGGRQPNQGELNNAPIRLSVVEGHLQHPAFEWSELWIAAVPRDSWRRGCGDAGSRQQPDADRRQQGDGSQESFHPPPPNWTWNGDVVLDLL